MAYFAGHAPLGDAGGYEVMLRHFLQTGTVDYMRWSQPTFVGILPVAAPWGLLFGTTTASLQLLGVVYGAALVTGLYVLLTALTRPAIAFLLCACLFCFGEFVNVIPTFMTDIPYGAYLVWFLVAQQRLAAMYILGPPAKRPTALWTAWAALFLLASLTRSFTLILVPLFAWLAFRKEQQDETPTAGHGAMSRATLPIAIAMSVLCLVLVRLLTRNGFSPLELTALPAILVDHDWKRFELRTLGVSLVQTSLIALPALTLCTGVQRGRLRVGDAVFGALGLFLAVWFTRKGLITPLILLPELPGVTRFVGLVQVALVPVGFILLGRVLQRAMLHSSDGFTPVLLTLFAAHFLVLPIMQHPLLRHVLPAYIVALPLIALSGACPGRRALAVAACSVALIGGLNLAAVYSARAVAQVEWQFASDLKQSGVPLDQIDGGWDWFCAYHLRPGWPDPDGYVARYYRLKATARYVVTSDASLLPDALVVRHAKIDTLNGVAQARVVDRGERLPVHPK